MDQLALVYSNPPKTPDRQTHDHDHDHGTDYVAQAKEYYDDGDYKSALFFYTSALNEVHATDRHELYNNRGCCYFNLGDYSGAIHDFETALSLRPGFTLAKQNLKASKQERNNRRWNNFFTVMSAVSAGLNQAASVNSPPSYVPYSGGGGGSSGTTNSSGKSGYMCQSCKGTGMCGTCSGKGTYRSSYSTSLLDCPNCSVKNGRICSVCDGTGRILRN